MDNTFLGEIRIFGGNFAPSGWAFCQGQLLPISQNAALFSILGVQFGGNGTSNFALPNLMECVPVHQGTGSGLTTRVVGDTFGSPTTTLTVNEMPNHNHQIIASSAGGTVPDPTNNIFAARGRGDNDLTSTTPNVVMSPMVVGVAGASQPISNMQPTLALNFIIALEGVFPQRS